MADILDNSAFESLKNANDLYFMSNLTLTLKMNSVLPLMNLRCEKIESPKKKCEKTYYMWLYDV